MATKLAIFADRLKHAELFEQVSTPHLFAIAEFCSERSYQDGDTIFTEGDHANILLVVERGKIALEKKVQIGRHSTPRNATIDYVGPGQMAGFSTIGTPHIYTTSAVCIEPTRIISIDGEMLYEYLELHPEVGLVVLHQIISLLRGRYERSINTLTYFLSVVSHELRSPLAAVENYIRTILEGFAGDLNAKQERMMNRSLLRVLDLRALIGDVVDLARMRPEQIQADFHWFDPGEIGLESIDDARLAAAEKNVRIKVEPPPKFEPMVGARRRMRQVFTNLLNNAIKYAPDNSTVIFRGRYQDNHLIMEVEDEGPGIPEEDLPHIFKDFYRASNVGRAPGTGLGLSIAKKIVDAHHGKIYVENLKHSDGKTGTRFSVEIPQDLKTPEMVRQEWLADAPSDDAYLASEMELPFDE
jgi:signal transduction histidine kinase